MPGRPQTLLLLLAHAVVRVHGAADPTPCVMNGCNAQCGSGSFDLSNLVDGTPGYLVAKDNVAQSYWFGVCGPAEGLTCGTGFGPQAVIQTWGSAQPPMFQSYECRNSGLFSTQACSMLDGSLTCLYTGGEDGRSTQIVYTCHAGATEMVAVDNGQNPPAYVVSVMSASACMAVPESGDQGLSGGGLFLILLSVAVLIYVGGGMYYNIKYKEMPQSMEAFPHIEYWRELPPLVKDGCAFSWKHTKIFAKEAHAYAVAHGYVNGDASLKEGLTAADEGSSTATEYAKSPAAAEAPPAKGGPDF